MASEQLNCGQCLAPGTRHCTGCHAIKYCSAECQLKNWPTHKLICSKWTTIPSRPSPNHRLAFFFPVAKDHPQPIWLPTKNLGGDTIFSGGCVQDLTGTPNTNISVYILPVNILKNDAKGDWNAFKTAIKDGKGYQQPLTLRYPVGTNLARNITLDPFVKGKKLSMCKGGPLVVTADWSDRMTGREVVRDVVAADLTTVQRAFHRFAGGSGENEFRVGIYGALGCFYEDDLEPEGEEVEDD